jgi:dethiobiotin synthetase
MKQIYFITATNTDVGKTYASEQFLKKFAQDGKKVGYLKPIETGVEEYPLDGSKLLKLTKELNPEFYGDINDVVPYQFELPAAPFVAKKDTKIDLDHIIKKASKLLKQCDILIVEGAGGLLVPLEKDLFIVDLIKEFEKHFQTNTILVVPSNLGSINDTLLSQNLLKQYDIKFKWYINLFKDKESFETITLPFYKDYFKTVNYL